MALAIGRDQELHMRGVQGKQDARSKTTSLRSILPYGYIQQFARQLDAEPWRTRTQRRQLFYR